MANPSVTNTFVPNTTATAAGMNQNFTDIVSGLSSGSTWDVITSSLTSTDLTVSEDAEFTNIPEFLKDLDLDGNDGCKGSFIAQTDSAPGSGAFLGGVLLPSGKVFCVPAAYSGTDYVFNAGATTKSAEPWCYHPMFNKL